ncbi:MAG: hypothetical protein AB1757_12595 [Acidobacteriota bacterium]
MFNLDTLDTLIALVIVLLTLALVVQAIQSALKKLFKLKSRQLEESLLDLFETVFDSAQNNGQTVATTRNQAVSLRLRMPTLQVIPFVKLPSTLASTPVKAIYDAVLKEFRKIGRVAASGKNMQESLSKEDLMKVLQKVDAKTFGNDFLSKLESSGKQFAELEKTIATVKTELLGGDAGTQFAKIQTLLAPLLNDLKRFINGDKTFNKDLRLADILNLRDIETATVLDFLVEVQRKVQERRAVNPDDADLITLDETLKKFAATFTGLSSQIDEIKTSLNLKLNEVENWYDTVMQSFEERYTRGMKTYAFIISLVVAVCMNANIFNVYDYVAKDADIRKAVIASREDVLQLYRAQLAAASVTGKADNKPSNTGATATSTADATTNTPATPPASNATNPTAKPTASAKAAQPPSSEKKDETVKAPGSSTDTVQPSQTSNKETLQGLVNETEKHLKDTTEQYAKFGFRTWEDELITLGLKEMPAEASGNSKYEPKWGGTVGHSFRMLLGWLIMAALLSLGAPFWHDLLESLFGVKTLLRKRGDIKNVETKSGAGMPQT